MQLKIKCIPADFIVEEIADLPLKDKSEYAVYILKKKDWNTIELLLELSRELNIPFNYFSFGGKKDKHAVTSQFITIRSPEIKELKRKKYSLQFCGFMAQPMAANLINRNKFEITVRDLSEKNIENTLKEIEIINSIGYPNYFDDQRFGSLAQKQNFIAEEILKRHFGNALKLYLTATNDSNKNEFFIEHWNDWNTCRKKSATKFEKKTFDFLIKNPEYFFSIIKRIPKEGLSDHFSAYNAYLWNEVLRRFIIEKSDELKTYSGTFGDYIFYTQIREENLNYLENLNIPTLPFKPEDENNLIDKIYSNVYQNRDIKYSMFNKIKIRQVFFKSTLRKAISKPEGLNFEISNDEIYTNRKKLILRFSLLRGSYGTMLIKRIFSSKS